MKILSAQQLREADSATIKNEPIASIDLMERAASACTQWLINQFGTNTSFKIFCGLGNNGGDGLAIARQLKGKNFDVEVVVVRYSDKCSDEFLENEKCLQNIPVINISSLKQLAPQNCRINSNPQTIFIDAIFGTGLNKPIDGITGDVIHFINNSKCKVVSIDIPTGLFCDKMPEGDTIVKARYTLTFQQPKLSFLFSDSKKFIEEFFVLDIELDKKYISQCTSKNFYTTFEDAKKIYEPREKFLHKGAYGHALIIAGSEGKMGAAILAVNGCMRAGAGLTTVHLPKCGCEIMQRSLPEAMVSVDSNENFISDAVQPGSCNAIGIGPGLGTEKQTVNVLKLLIQNSTAPMVIDADALNILSENKTWISFLPKGSILTPHPKEFDRLTGNHSTGFERWVSQKEFSVKHGIHVVLKGAHTSITSPEGTTYFNSTGNPGMAKGGSGDALTGIITALLAQGYSPKDSAILGVYIHGLAGNIAAKKKSEEAMLVSDLIGELGEAFKKLKL